MKRPRSLLLRIFAAVSLMILMPSLLSFIFFFEMIPTKMEDQAKINTDFYIEQVAASVGNSLALARDMAYNAMADNTLRTSMREGNTNLHVLGRPALERAIGSSITFQSRWNQQSMNCIYLIRDDGQYIFYSPTGAYAEEQRRILQIYEQMRDVSSARTLFASEDADSGLLYFLLDYKNIDYLTHLGKFIIELNAEAMLSSSDLTDLYEGAYLSLTGGSGQTVVYQEGEAPNGLLSSGASETQDVSEYIGGGSFRSKNRYYHIRRRIEEYDLWLEVYIPTQAMYNHIWATNRIYLSTCVLCLLITLVIAVMLYGSVKKFTNRIMQTLTRMTESDYTARLPQSHYIELASLIQTFNRMADHLAASFEDAYQKGIQLQESESRLLTAQINPHFIFNVLETINMRCIDIGQKDISRIVTDLAQFLRGNIGSDGQKITFEQELNYVRYYIDLQQSRFGEKLTYSIAYVDEEILQYQLPRLTIQPLVENAIVHGLEPRRELGHVSIRLWEEDNSIYIRIEDNGVGFQSDALDFSELPEQSASHNHIALSNILRRLHLFYGEQASLHIRSTPGHGTVVLLILPIDRKEA